MSETPPRYVTCPCQHCASNIEFDAGEFNEGEARTIECPHCHLETSIFIPPVISSTPPRLTSQPIWFGSEKSFVEISLISGASVKIKAVHLYDETRLQELASKKVTAMELLQGVSDPYAAIGSPLWVVMASTVSRAMENRLSQKSAQEGLKSLQQLALEERKFREQVTFFPVGQIQDIEHPSPGLWRVPSKPSGFVHSGDEFVTVMDVEGSVCAVRWSAVERYNYQANR